MLLTNSAGLSSSTGGTVTPKEHQLGRPSVEAPRPAYLQMVKQIGAKNIGMRQLCQDVVAFIDCRSTRNVGGYRTSAAEERGVRATPGSENMTCQVLLLGEQVIDVRQILVGAVF